MRLLIRACLAAYLLAAALPCAASGTGNRLELKDEYFWDKNKVWNQTPAFSLTQALSRIWSFGWEQEFDFVTGASRRIGLDKVGLTGDRDIDAVSGASKIEMRYSENPSLTYSEKGTVATGSLYYSREDDYVSISPAASVSFDFNERNTTVGASYAEFFHDFKPTGAFAGQGGKKRITSLGEMMTEAVPNHKQGGALSSQIVQGFQLGDRLGSLNLDYRRYQDDWALKSNTLDAKLSQYFTETAYVRFRLRYYNQTGTAFAKEYYTGNEVYRTADIRWFPFTSWLGGIKISAAFPEDWGKSVFLPDRWDIKFDYTLRDTRGDKVAQAAGDPRTKKRSPP